MRPLRAAAAIRAIQITSRFPDVHGAPVHIGDPALIGIRDLARNADRGRARLHRTVPRTVEMGAVGLRMVVAVGLGSR